VEQEVSLHEWVAAPVASNTPVGEILYTHDGNEVGRSQLVITEPIDKAAPGDIMKRLFNRWLFS
jgi:hypothetical protein